MNNRLQTKRLPYLDSARGLAAISVITFHFLMAVYSPGIIDHYGSLTHFFWYGEANVIFFFIHSGFILAYSYAGKEAKLSGKYYIKFLIERVFRIYPLFLLILFISFIAINNTPAYQYATGNSYIEVFWNQHRVWTDYFKESLLVVRIPDPANLRLVPQDWTLTVELLAGAAVPLLAFAGKKHLLLFILLLAGFKAGNFLTTYIVEFGMGVFLFLIKEDIINNWQKSNKYIKAFVLLAAFVFYSCFFVFSSLFAQEVYFINQRIDRLIVGVGCMLFFVLLLSSPKVQRFLSLNFLVDIGKICYSIYLLHQMLLLIFWRQYGSFFHNLSGRSPILVIVIYLAYLCLIILLSKILFKLVERPANMLGKKIAKSI